MVEIGLLTSSLDLYGLCGGKEKDAGRAGGQWVKSLMLLMGFSITKTLELFLMKLHIACCLNIRF